ncbi:MAG TPA: hypothetical protein VGM86_03325 [Thermoanaerobaculia bacterium]|jgi:hypothetical protein
MEDNTLDVEPTEADFDFDEEVDDEGNLYQLFTCPACKRRLREPMRGKKAGDEIVCPCGETKIVLQGDPGGFQDSVDGIERTIRDVLKGL